MISTCARELCATVLYHRLGCVLSDGVQVFGRSRMVPVSDYCSCGLRERKLAQDYAWCEGIIIVL